MLYLDNTVFFQKLLIEKLIEKLLMKKYQESILSRPGEI